MKKFSVWFFSLIVLFYSFASAVPVKASSPTFNVDYSNLLTSSQISGLMSGLSASGLSALYNSLGGLGYAYLQSVNVDVNSSSPSSVLYDLGEMVYNFLVNPLPNQVAGSTAKYLYDLLSPQTKYQVSTLVQDASSGSLNETNYSTFKYEWKTQVSEPMSDIFNTYNRLVGFTSNSDAFFSAASSLGSDIWSLSSSDFIDVPSNFDDIYFSVHSVFPSAYSVGEYRTLGSVSFGGASGYNNYSFDSVLFFDNYDFYDDNYYYFVLDGSSVGSINPSRHFPIVFFDSSSHSFYNVPLDLSGSNYIYFKPISTYFLGYGWSKYTATSSFDGRNRFYFSSSPVYDFPSTYKYFLSLSRSLPSYLSSASVPGINGVSTLTNVFAYHVSLDSSSRYISLSDFSPISLDPISIDPGQAYQGSLQIPIDNAPGEVATLDIQSVIDAINDNSLVNNIDLLGDIISDGIVGSIPTYSVDAWSPDAANEYVHVSDLSLGLEGVQSLEGTFTDNVQPVFDSFPLFPFIAPIWNTFQQYPVIGLITACIFLVVLFGFLNKLLF